MSVGGVAGRPAGGLGRGRAGPGSEVGVRLRRRGPGSAGAGWRPPRPAARRARRPRRGSGRRGEGAGGTAAEPGRGSGARPGPPVDGGRSESGVRARGVPLLGRGTWGATVPAACRQGRQCPPGPHRRRTTLSASFLGCREARESPGSREGKVLNWGFSGSGRGGWGERGESRDRVLGFRSEAAGGVAETRRGQREHFVN